MVAKKKSTPIDVGKIVQIAAIGGVAAVAYAAYQYTQGTPPVGGGDYTITASAGPNGTISPIGQVPVVAGANQTFTITPNSGYQIDTLSVDGVIVTPLIAYTFTNVVANHTISVTFIAIAGSFKINRIIAGDTNPPSGHPTVDISDPVYFDVEMFNGTANTVNGSARLSIIDSTGSDVLGIDAQGSTSGTLDEPVSLTAGQTKIVSFFIGAVPPTEIDGDPTGGIYKSICIVRDTPGTSGNIITQGEFWSGNGHTEGEVNINGTYIITSSDIAAPTINPPASHTFADAITATSSVTNRGTATINATASMTALDYDGIYRQILSAGTFSIPPGTTSIPWGGNQPSYEKQLSTASTVASNQGVNITLNLSDGTAVSKLFTGSQLPNPFDIANTFRGNTSNFFNIPTKINGSPNTTNIFFDFSSDLPSWQPGSDLHYTRRNRYLDPFFGFEWVDLPQGATTYMWTTINFNVTGTYDVAITLANSTKGKVITFGPFPIVISSPGVYWIETHVFLGSSDFSIGDTGRVWMVSTGMVGSPPLESNSFSLTHHRNPDNAYFDDCFFNIV